MKTKALSREDRKRQIMLAFAVNLQSGHDGKMTLTDIAHKVGVTPSTKFRVMVSELEIEGLLTSVTEPLPGITKFRRIYSPTALFDADRGERKHQPRTIAIKARRNGQQVLFKEVIS